MTVTSETIRVLHVDDDSALADVVATVLEREDDRFDVETAISAEAGIDRLTTDDFDCVVSDYDMSGRDGIEFLQAVRAEYPDLPFILYTGKGSETVASEAISGGVTDYLQKGSGLEQYELLANRIVNAVEAYRSRRLAEERTRQLETLISTLPGMVYRCRNEPDWPMETVAGDVEELTGYSADALTDHRVRWGEDVIHPDDRTSVWESAQAGIAEKDTFEVTYRIRTREGTIKRVWERGRGVYTDEGELVALEGFITDITEREQQERQLEAIAEATTKEAIYLKDREGRYRFINRAGAQVFGRTPAEVIGERAADLYDSVDRDRLAVDERVLETERPLTYEVSRVVDGEERYFLAEKRPYYENGELAGLVGISRDITERREYERELERERDRLAEFANVVSHDLRSPLNVVEGRLEYVREECDSDHFEAIDTALDRMHRIIADVLWLAREGRDIGDTAPVDLREAVEAAWEVTGGSRTNAELTVADGDSLGVIEADEDRLRQLLENLFANAIEYGGDDVTVTVGELPDGFYVADDGPGIPEDSREEVFEPGHSTSETGTGFGLTIVKQVAEAHGWTVRVTDGPTGGTRVEISRVAFQG